MVIVDSQQGVYLPVDHKPAKMSGRARTHLQLVLQNTSQSGIEDSGIGRLALAEVGPGEATPEDRYVRLGIPAPITFKDHRFEDLGILVEAVERLRRRVIEFQCQRWGLRSGHDQSTHDSVEYDMEREESTTSHKARFTKEVKGNRRNGQL